MELIYSRRLLRPNEDEAPSPRSPLPLLLHHSPNPTTNSSSPPESMPASSLLSGRPLDLQLRPAFNYNIGYTILILLAVFFLLGFISMYIRRFAIDSPSAVSFRRRRHLHHSFPSSSNHYSPSASRGGLDPTTVQSLPVFAYSLDAKQQLDCAICLSEFEEGEPVKIIPYCKHVFHQECVDTWLFSHLTCPICRCTKIFQVNWQGGSDKEEENSDQGVRSHQARSMVENGERRGQDGEMGSQSERRTTSNNSCYSSFGDGVVLARTMSY